MPEGIENAPNPELISNYKWNLLTNFDDTIAMIELLEGGDDSWFKVDPEKAKRIVDSLNSPRMQKIRAEGRGRSIPFFEIYGNGGTTRWFIYGNGDVVFSRHHGGYWLTTQNRLKRLQEFGVDMTKL